VQAFGEGRRLVNPRLGDSSAIPGLRVPVEPFARARIGPEHRGSSASGVLFAMCLGLMLTMLKPRWSM
jgi:hypothetical protein